MKHILFLIILFSSSVSYCQREVVASGGNASGSGGSVSYSLGQVAYQSVTGTNGNVNQGVQQPFEIFTLSNSEFDTSFSAILFPNPAAVSVTLSIDLSKEGANYDYELTDVTGKRISHDKITADETTINVEGLAEACYFLNILNGNKRVKTFKLLKNN